MENITLETIIEDGWELALRYEHSMFSICIWKPEWESSILPLPNGCGETIIEACNNLFEGNRELLQRIK